MRKRYRLIVNGEWLISSDDFSAISDMASRIWIEAMEEENGYYGNFPDIIIYDTVERREI